MPAGQTSLFSPRWPPKAASAAWLGWLAVAFVLSGPPLLWHLDYYRKPGPIFHQLLLLGLPLLGCTVWLYQRIRRKRLWRCELLALAGLLFAGCGFREPLATVIGVWLVVACYALGRSCLETLGLKTEPPSADIAISTAAGSGVFICVLFLIGLAHGYYPLVFALLLTLPCALLFRQARHLGLQLWRIHGRWGSEQALASSLLGVAMPLVVIFLLMTMMVALAPSIGSDAMRNHLPAIRYYTAQHALLPVPYSNHSYYPQSVEILMTLAYGLGGQAAAQMVNPIFFVLTLLLGYAVARRAGIEPLSAIVGVAVAGTIPFLHWTGSILKNDFALAYFQLAALYCYLRGRHSENANWLRLGVFLLAMSLGVKHVALFGAVPLGVLYLQAIWRRAGRHRLALSLVLILAVFGLFWHVRTLVLTGSPVYPIQLRTALHQFDPIEGARPTWPLLYLEYPWIFHFAGKMSFESPTANPLGMFFVFAWPVWLLVRRGEPRWEERACLFFVLLYYLYWGYIWGVLRYALVPVMLLCLFTTARLVALHDASSRWIRGSIQGAVAYCLVFAWLVTMLIEVNAPQLRFYAGQLDRRGYLREAVADFRSLEYIEAHAVPDDRILSINNYAHGYAPVAGQFQALRVRDPTRGVEFAKEQLHNSDYSFLIVPTSHRDAFVEALSSTHALIFAYGDEHFSVYRLRPRAGSSQADAM